jgi:hypothetical protein
MQVGLRLNCSAYGITARCRQQQCTRQISSTAQQFRCRSTQQSQRTPARHTCQASADDSSSGKCAGPCTTLPQCHTALPAAVPPSETTATPPPPQRDPPKQAAAAAQAHHSFFISCCVACCTGMYAGPEVYQGMFGPWSIEPADEFEVLTYRVGLTATWAGEGIDRALISRSQLLQLMQTRASTHSRVCNSTSTAERACCPYTGSAPHTPWACAPAWLDLRC